MQFKFLRFVALIVLGLGSAPLFADALPATKSDVLLTISGTVGETNLEGAAAFDLDMLRQLPVETIETTTIWTEGVSTFVGVPLAALLERVDAGGSQILASAINDYSVTIPVDSLTETAPIIAYELNGNAMSRRQKGPLWVIYPYDKGVEFRTDVIYTRSIWQLDRMEILE